MKLEKKPLLAALKSAARMAAPRHASHWLRTSHLRAVGMGDEIEFCAWGAQASLRAILPGDGAPGEVLAALSNGLFPIVEAALGEHVELRHESLIGNAARLLVESDGRSGACEHVSDSTTFAPPPAVVPAQLAGTATLFASQAAGFARALRLGADCVDREGTPETARHVAIHQGLALVVLATDGANCVYWTAPVAAHGSEVPIALTPDGARLLADAVSADGAEAPEVRLEVVDAGVRAKVGPTTLNVLRLTNAHVLSLSAVAAYLAARDEAGRVTVDPKVLIGAARYAGLFATPRTTATVLEWGPSGGSVRSWDRRGSTAIAMRSKKAGSASFSGERLARALSGLDGEERGDAVIVLDGAPKEPLQVLVKGSGWERRHIVASMSPEEEKT